MKVVIPFFVISCIVALLIFAFNQEKIHVEDNEVTFDYDEDTAFDRTLTIIDVVSNARKWNITGEIDSAISGWVANGNIAQWFGNILRITEVLMFPIQCVVNFFILIGGIIDAVR